MTNAREHKNELLINIDDDGGVRFYFHCKTILRLFVDFYINTRETRGRENDREVGIACCRTQHDLTVCNSFFFSDQLHLFITQLNTTCSSIKNNIEK